MNLDQSSFQNMGVCVIILSSDRQNVLLGKRLNSYGEGLFGIPGGRVELEEGLEVCGIRELKEEVGIEVQQLEYVGVIREFQKDFDFVHFAFLCNEYQEEIKNMEPDKCEKWDWYPLSSLPENMMKGHKAAIEMYLDSAIHLKDLVE